MQYVAVCHGPQGGTVVWLGEMDEKNVSRARQFAAGGLSSIAGGSKYMFKLVNENANIYWDDELLFSFYEDEGEKTKALYNRMMAENKRGQRLLIIKGINDRELNYAPYGIPDKSGIIDRIERWEWNSDYTINEKIEYIIHFGKKYKITGWTKAAVRRDHSGKNPKTGKSQVIRKRINSTYALLRKIDKTAQAIANGDSDLSIGDWPNPYLDDSFPEINGRTLPPPTQPSPPEEPPL